LELLIVLERAHEESCMKSARIKDVWRSWRKDVRCQGACPAWLRSEGGEWVVIPERVALVRRISGMVRDGVGQNRIASILNNEGICTWRAGKRTSKWQASTVKVMMAS